MKKKAEKKSADITGYGEVVKVEEINDNTSIDFHIEILDFYEKYRNFHLSKEAAMLLVNKIIEKSK